MRWNDKICLGIMIASFTIEFGDNGGCREDVFY